MTDEPDDWQPPPGDSGRGLGRVGGGPGRDPRTRNRGGCMSVITTLVVMIVGGLALLH